MKDKDYKLYRNTMDYLNNNYTANFWSVERLVRFSFVPQHKILAYETVENEIVLAIGKIEGIKKSIKANQKRDEVDQVLMEIYNRHKDICSILKEAQSDLDFE